jgi:hypothetical protein
MTTRLPVKPDDHSEVVPLLPIPNRKVKRLCADDSAGSRVKVGHCQAIYLDRPSRETGPFPFSEHEFHSAAPDANVAVLAVGGYQAGAQC